MALTTGSRQSVNSPRATNRPGLNLMLFTQVCSGCQWERYSFIHIHAFALVMGIIRIPILGSTSKLIIFPVVRSAFRTLLTSSIFTNLFHFKFEVGVT